MAYKNKYKQKEWLAKNQDKLEIAQLKYRAIEKFRETRKKYSKTQKYENL